MNGAHDMGGVHGFGAVVLAQAVWLILVGAELRRDAPVPARPHG